MFRGYELLGLRKLHQFLLGSLYSYLMALPNAQLDGRL